MELKLFDYFLPEELIAQSAVSPKEAARLMCLDKKSFKLTSATIGDLPEIVNSDYVLVFNDTKVFPARLLGQKETGGKVELLLLHPERDCWWAISRPGLAMGQKIKFEDLKAEVIERRGEKVKISFDLMGESLIKKIDQLGKMPLPPYINSSESEEKLREDYQTVYAANRGSVAAPTAGLHFSKELLERLKNKGVSFEFVTLHVGLGTFKSVKTDDITDHPMHAEWYELAPEVAQRLNKAKENGKKVLSVGTTSCRVLESCANEDGKLKEGAGETAIFIYPPYKFRFIDGLLTNFHLPKSTLLMLVAAFVSWPNSKTHFESFKKSLVGKAYQKAIEEKWRFYSFGDAMLVI